RARPLFLVCRHRQTLADERHRLAPLPASAETQPVCRNTATSRGAGMTTTAERLAVEGGRPTRADRLPLHRPWFDHREASAVSRVLAGTHVAGDGACGKELERLLRDSTGVRAVLAVNSCTAALEMA